ncbi:hypothetical protein F2Q68_00045233 [Brassica cretica]|uniref:Aminotransferase class V domain-containing protein n=1 Tax=Brassica cretica TaxID=69181 RepID=A0A8S9LJP3_BRACR|nr:hypothetical protein F2Q68_00045233 [Brassica cretica]
MIQGNRGSDWMTWQKKHYKITNYREEKNNREIVKTTNSPGNEPKSQLIHKANREHSRVREEEEANQIADELKTAEANNNERIERNGYNLDYSSQLVVPSVMEFVKRFEGGIDGIMERNHDEAVRMGLMLCGAWGTNLGSPPEMCVAMVMIGLPSKLCVESDEDAAKLRSYLRVHRSVEVPVYFLGLRDGEEGVKDKDSGVITAYVRISRQVYNETEDYERLRDAITELVKDQMTCQNLPPV